MQDRNGQYDRQEILDTVDAAVKWTRGHRAMRERKSSICTLDTSVAWE